MPNLLLAFFLLVSALVQTSAGAGVQAPAVANAGEAPPRDPNVELAWRMAAAKAVIRRHVALMYGAECSGAIELPDDAFLPVEITGFGMPELAVSLALARCGESASTFTGTGGVHMLFWRIEDGRATLLLDQSMHGFTPASPYLVTMQHGGFCPGGAGPLMCRVVYRWDTLGSRLETEDRHLLGDERPVFDYGRLTGTSRCPPEEAARRRCRRD